MNLSYIHLYQILHHLQRYGINTVLFFLFTIGALAASLYTTKTQKNVLLENSSALIKRELQTSFYFCGFNERPDCKQATQQSQQFCILSLCSGEMKNCCIDDRVPIKKKSDLWSFAAEGSEAQGQLTFCNASPQCLTACYHNMQKESAKPVEVVFNVCLIDDAKQMATTLQAECMSSDLFTLQGLKWYGPDLFLKEHDLNKADIQNRIYLQDTPFATVAAQQKLVWVEDHWQKGEECNTQVYPIAVLEKESEHSLQWALWNISGIKKYCAILPKSSSNNVEETIFSDWTALQIHSLDKATVSIDLKKQQINVQDWWLRRKGKWKKICSAEQIEKYMSHKIFGELLICDGIAIDKGQQVLYGHLFNLERTLRYQWTFYEKQQHVILIPT